MPKNNRFLTVSKLMFRTVRVADGPYVHLQEARNQLELLPLFAPLLSEGSLLLLLQRSLLLAPQLLDLFDWVVVLQRVQEILILGVVGGLLELVLGREPLKPGARLGPQHEGGQFELHDET